jgi:hypothetical protein
MNADTAIRNLSTLRTAVGLGAWLTPRLAGKAFLLDPDGNPQSPYLARLFGARDVALAYGTLNSRATLAAPGSSPAWPATWPTRWPRSPAGAAATCPGSRPCSWRPRRWPRWPWARRRWPTAASSEAGAPYAGLKLLAFIAVGAVVVLLAAQAGPVASGVAVAALAVVLVTLVATGRM